MITHTERHRYRDFCVYTKAMTTKRYKTKTYDFRKPARLQHLFTYCINYSVVVVLTSSKNPLLLIYLWLCMVVIRVCAYLLECTHWCHHKHICTILSISSTMLPHWFLVTPRALQHTLQVIMFYTVSEKIGNVIAMMKFCVSTAIVHSIRSISTHCFEVLLEYSVLTSLLKTFIFTVVVIMWIWRHFKALSTLSLSVCGWRSLLAKLQDHTIIVEKRDTEWIAQHSFIQKKNPQTMRKMRQVKKRRRKHSAREQW